MENENATSSADSRTPRRTAFLLSEQADIADGERPFWGGNWAARFAANFTEPSDSGADPAADGLAAAVNAAIDNLAEIERRIILDYHILCLSRRAIALRYNLGEHEVDSVRVRAERRLQRTLARFVEMRFGLSAGQTPECPLCSSTRCTEIDDFLARRRPEDSWGALRRALNGCFGLTITRVQILMTHCRDHMLQHDTSPQPGEENYNE